MVLSKIEVGGYANLWVDENGVAKVLTVDYDETPELSFPNWHKEVYTIHNGEAKFEFSFDLVSAKGRRRLNSLLHKLVKE